MNIGELARQTGVSIPNGQSLGHVVFPYGYHTNNVYAVPLTGDFNGDGLTDIGVYQPNNNLFALNFLGPGRSLGQAVFSFGASSNGVRPVPLTLVKPHSLRSLTVAAHVFFGQPIGWMVLAIILSVVFVCINGGPGTSPVETVSETLALKALAYGIAGVRVDELARSVAFVVDEQ